MASYTTTADYKVYSENGKWYLEIVTPIYGEGVTATVKYPNVALGGKINGLLTDPPTQSYTLNNDGWIVGTINNSGYKLKIAVHFPEGLRAIGIKDGKNYPLVVDLQYRIRSFNGVDWNDWSTPLNHRVSGINKDAFTEVIEYDLPTEYLNKKIEVGVRRVTFDIIEPKNEEKRYYYRCSLQTVTAYQKATPESFVLKDPPKPTDTRLAKTAFRIKATNQVNGNLEGINCVVQTVTKIWTGQTPQGTSGSWAIVENEDGEPLGTSNPAALFLYVLTHPGNPRRIEWDSNILQHVDMEQIQRWYLYCEDVHFNSSNTTEIVSRKRGTVFRFNDIVGEQKGVFEILRDICAAGRASPALVNNKWTVVIDEPKDLVSQHFTPHNSWGFESTKLLPRRPDAIKVQYFDENSDYQQKEVVIAAPGFTEDTAELFETISFAGITNGNIAKDHGQWHFAQTLLRPEIYTINTDVEYLVCNRGDRVKVTHDIPMWGTATGRIKNVISSTQLELDEEIEMLKDKIYTIRIRSVDSLGNILSQVSDIVPVLTDSYATTITLSTPLSNIAAQDLFMIGEQDNESHDLIVLSIEPSNAAKTARLTLVDYAEPLFTGYKNLTNIVFDPNITNLPPAQVESTGTAVPTVLFNRITSDDRVMEKLSSNNFIYGIKIPYSNTLDLDSYPTIAYVEAEASLVENGVISTPITASVPFDAGAVVIRNVEEGKNYRLRLRYVTRGGNTGLWSNAVDHTVVGKTAPPANVTSLTYTISQDKVTVSWDTCPNIDYDATELRYVRNDDPLYDELNLETIWNSITLTTDPETTKNVLWVGKTNEYVVAKPKVDYTYKILAKHKDLNGIYSVRPAEIDVVLDPPENVANLTAVINPGHVTIEWDACLNIDYAATELRYVLSTDPFYNSPDWDLATFIWQGAGTQYLWVRPANGIYKILARHKDLNDNYSKEFTVAVIEVTDLIDIGQYKVEIISSNGLLFRADQDWATTLTAKVYKNNEEVTASLPASRFKWTRVTYPTTTASQQADADWNAQYAASPAKTINLTDNDVSQQMTYSCEILSE